MKYEKNDSGYPEIFITKENCPQTKAKAEELLQNLKKDWYGLALVDAKRHKVNPPKVFNPGVYIDRHYEDILEKLARYGSPEVIDVVYGELNKDVSEAVFGQSPSFIFSSDYEDIQKARYKWANRICQTIAMSGYPSKQPKTRENETSLQLWWQEAHRFDILHNNIDLFDSLKNFRTKIKSVSQLDHGKSGLFLYALKNSSFATDLKSRVQVVAEYSDYLKSVKEAKYGSSEVDAKQGREQRHKDILKIAIEDLQEISLHRNVKELYENPQEYLAFIKTLNFLYCEVASKFQPELKNFDSNGLETLLPMEKMAILKLLINTFLNLHKQSVLSGNEDINLLIRIDYCYHIAMKISPEDGDFKHAYHATLNKLFLNSKNDPSKIELIKKYNQLSQELGVGVKPAGMPITSQETPPMLPEKAPLMQPEDNSDFLTLKSSLLASDEFKRLKTYGENHKIKKSSIEDYVDKITQANDLNSLREAIKSDPSGEKYSMRANTFTGIYAFFHRGKSTSDSLAIRLSEKLDALIGSQEVNSKSPKPSIS